MVYTVQIQCRDSPKLMTNGQNPLHFLVEGIPEFIYIQLYPPANNCSKYADAFHNSMSDDKDIHIPSPLLMFTCNALRHALLECQKSNSVYPKASKSKLKEDRPDCSNYFNSMNDGHASTSCCASTGRKSLTPPRVGDKYTILMNSSNLLPGSYQQRVYKTTLATVTRQIQQAENPTPAVAISVEAVRVGNAILLDYLTSDVPLDEHEMGSAD